MKARITALAPAARSSAAATALRCLRVAIALLAAIALQPVRAAEDQFLEPDKAFQFSATAHDARSSKERGASWSCRRPAGWPR